MMVSKIMAFHYKNWCSFHGTEMTQHTGWQPIACGSDWASGDVEQADKTCLSVRLLNRPFWKIPHSLSRTPHCTARHGEFWGCSDERLG